MKQQTSNETEMKNPTFEEAMQMARSEFWDKVNEQGWNTELRTAAEDFLIAFDLLFQDYENVKRKHDNAVNFINDLH